MDASPETSGGTPSADQYVERLSPESSQSRSITSRSSRSSSKRSSAGVKAPLAKLRLEQAEERFKRELSKEANLQETKEIEEKFRKEREESRKRRRRQAEELEKHCCLIEKRRSEAKRERELELLRLKHRQEAAKLKRSILDQLSEGSSNVIVNHTFSKHGGFSSDFYRSVTGTVGQTALQRPIYSTYATKKVFEATSWVRKEITWVSAVKVCVIGPARFRNGILSGIQPLLILPYKVPNLVAWKTLV